MPTFDGPEGKRRGPSVVELASGQEGQAVRDNGQDDHGIGPPEGQVAVHRGDQGAVCVEVDLRQGMGESEEPGAHRRQDGTANGPLQG